jgi:hypothetical protein
MLVSPGALPGETCHAVCKLSVMGGRRLNMYTNRMNCVCKIVRVPGLSMFGRCLLKCGYILIEIAPELTV